MHGQDVKCAPVQNFRKQRSIQSPNLFSINCGDSALARGNEAKPSFQQKRPRMVQQKMQFIIPDRISTSWSQSICQKMPMKFMSAAKYAEFRTGNIFRNPAGSILRPGAWTWNISSPATSVLGYDYGDGTPSSASDCRYFNAKSYAIAPIAYER